MSNEEGILINTCRSIKKTSDNKFGKYIKHREDMTNE